MTNINVDQPPRLRENALAAMHISHKYEVLDQLGQGGMGVVYKVRHVDLAPVSQWFTECFGTADSKEAKAFLEELA